MSGGGYHPVAGSSVAGVSWVRQVQTLVFRAAPGPGQLPAIAVAAATIFTPTVGGYFRGWSCNAASADPLVGAGGATTVSIGTTGAGNLLVNALAIASFNNSVICWGGGSGPRVNDGLNGVMDEGIIIAPAGGVPGAAAVSRLIIIGCNAGTVTGTLHVRFEFRPFAGGGF